MDFLKIDVECQAETTMHGRKSVGETARESIKGMEASVGLYFDGACINCTGMGHEMLWNRPVGMVNRNSADFEYFNVKSMMAFVNNNIFQSLCLVQIGQEQHYLSFYNYKVCFQETDNPLGMS